MRHRPKHHSHPQIAGHLRASIPVDESISRCHCCAGGLASTMSRFQTRPLLGLPGPCWARSVSRRYYRWALLPTRDRRPERVCSMIVQGVSLSPGGGPPAFADGLPSALTLAGTLRAWSVARYASAPMRRLFLCREGFFRRDQREAHRR